MLVAYGVNVIIIYVQTQRHQLVRCARLPVASFVLTQKTISLVQDTSGRGLRTEPENPLQEH